MQDWKSSCPDIQVFLGGLNEQSLIPALPEPRFRQPWTRVNFPILVLQPHLRKKTSPFLQAQTTLPQTLAGWLSPPRPRINPKSRPPPGRPHHVPLMARGGPVLAQDTLQADHHGPDHIQPQVHHHCQGHSAPQRPSVSSE